MTREEFIEEYGKWGLDDAEYQLKFIQDLDELLKQEAIICLEFVAKDNWVYNTIDGKWVKIGKNTLAILTENELYQLYKDKQHEQNK